MYEYLEIKIYEYLSLVLLTSNVPLRIGKIPLEAHVPQVGNLCTRTYSWNNFIFHACRATIYFMQTCNNSFKSLAA